ncbi:MULTISPECIES: hypothetical protein [unclassified Marinobacter]|uniref:hypothetical protein n=1 Tax=unclassified Marinobacter TaxID=83889 RepID=UPI001267E198|nr:MULTISPECIES: hypothetical protein [unclassified Marinobacter]QFS86632.1 hypothetical protein FIV08_07270 [Marinobacter sp. THAF197a]QFT50416.1 hypothetical protein FIU96_07200 [Marinobacter sp. THAF39]QFT52938.1 hypothetical protein FIU96_20005 [Marinobacter sp. THAF39]
MIVTHRDLRALKYCNNGSREFFRRHGLDWSEFVKVGLPEEEFLSTGDAMAIRLVEFAREQREKGK